MGPLEDARPPRCGPVLTREVQSLVVSRWILLHHEEWPDRGTPVRIYPLDAVRGALAIGVMVYHVTYWSGGAEFTSLGTYGVYAFFALSGVALEHVYGHRLRLGQFALARVARLAPLWLITVLLSIAVFGPVSPDVLLLNATGLFGFVEPGRTSIPVGGWSIGIEVGLYVLFVVLASRRLPTWSVLGLTAAALSDPRANRGFGSGLRPDARRCLGLLHSHSGLRGLLPRGHGRCAVRWA